MQYKLRLATNILLEIEAIKECENVEGQIALAEELTRNAAELAQIVFEELEKEKIA